MTMRRSLGSMTTTCLLGWLLLSLFLALPAQGHSSFRGFVSQDETPRSSVDLHHRRLSKERETPSPTVAPTSSLVPTVTPSHGPSVGPSAGPSFSPSVVPSVLPTLAGSGVPSVAPSQAASQVPTQAASATPTTTAAPTVAQTVSRLPSSLPSVAPSGAPTGTLFPSRTQTPSGAPTVVSSGAPTQSPTTLMPTTMPTQTQVREDPTFAPVTLAPVLPTARPSLAALSGSLALAPFALQTSDTVPGETLAQVTSDFLLEGLSSKYLFLTQVIVLPQAANAGRRLQDVSLWGGQARFAGPPPVESEFHEDQLFLLQGDGLQTALRNHPDVSDDVVVTAVEQVPPPDDNGDDNGPNTVAVMVPVLSALAVTILAATLLIRRRRQDDDDDEEGVRHLDEVDVPPPPPPPLAEFLVQSATAAAATDGLSMITMDEPFSGSGDSPTKKDSPSFAGGSHMDADSVVSKLQLPNRSGGVLNPEGSHQLLLAPIPQSALAASKRRIEEDEEEEEEPVTPVQTTTTTTSPKTLGATSLFVEEKKEDDDHSKVVATSSSMMVQRDEDSMDGYSLASSEPISSVASKWLANAIALTTAATNTVQQPQPQEEYHSDSESQFSFAQVGAESVTAQSLLRGSMSEDEEVGEEVDYQDALRLLQTIQSSEKIKAESHPTPQSLNRLHGMASANMPTSEQRQATLDKDQTPQSTNRLRDISNADTQPAAVENDMQKPYSTSRLHEISTASEEPPSLSWSNANKARLLGDLSQEDDEEDDPLRAAVYTPMAVTTTTTSAFKVTTPSPTHHHETDSVPSDELEDARDQDLEAFAAELEQLQSEARLPVSPDYFFTPQQQRGTKKSPQSSSTTVPTLTETPASSVEASQLLSPLEGDPTLTEYLRERRRAQYALHQQ